MWFAMHVKPGCKAMNVGEEEFVNLWAAPDNRVCSQSEGWINKAGYLVLEAGPLLDRQDAIEKFSRNRRWASLKTTIAGKPTRFPTRFRTLRRDHLKE